MEPRKQAILTALSAFFNQRPGMDPRNYDRAGYQADSRRVQQQRRDAQTLLMAVSRIDEIDADALLAASERAFGGRLLVAIEPTHSASQQQAYAAARTRGGIAEMPPPDSWRANIDYCAGQYWCTEFRAAACAVLASALWDDAREHCMPKPISGPVRDRYDMPGSLTGHGSAGDWLRAYFRSQFGRGIASRWFS